MIKKFNEFSKSTMLKEGIQYKSFEQLNANWKKDLKKPDHIYCWTVDEYLLYQYLSTKGVPPNRKPIKIQKSLYKFGVISDKSFFNSSSGVWEVYTVTQQISDEIVKLETTSSGGKGYTDFLYIKDKGVFALGGNAYNRDYDKVPDEYKKYI